MTISTSAVGLYRGHKNYWTADRVSDPYVIVRGTVLAAWDSLGYYDVATDYGRFVCSYSGSATHSVFGAYEISGYTAGQEVLVALCPGQAGLAAWIIGGVPYTVGAGAGVFKPTLMYPQVSGLDILYDTDNNPTSDLYAGKSYQLLRRLRKMGFGPGDTVDGDWGVFNYFGAGLGVEAFRSFIRGGPLSGFTVFSEDDSARVSGKDLEIITFGRQYSDRQLGPGIVEHDRRIYYPMDGVFDNSPQIVRIDGPQHSGFQEFRTYRPSDNNDTDPNLDGNIVPGYKIDANGVVKAVTGVDRQVTIPDGCKASELKQRMALLHEYRGEDGTYILTAARSLTLRKSFTVQVPIEILNDTVNADDPQFNKKANRTATQDGGINPPHVKYPLPEEPEPAFVAQNIPLPDTSGKLDPGVPVPQDFSLERRSAQVQGDYEATDPNMPWSPVDGGDQQATVVQNPRIADAPNTSNSIAHAMSSLGRARYLTDWQARSGFDRLPEQWRAGRINKKLFPQNIINDESTSLDPGMWKCVPRNVEIFVEPYQASKRIILGTAIIAINEDGSITIQAANGERIILGGGNIVMQAPHDVITHAGRNAMTISGRDTAIRASRHVDVDANEGRLTMAAASQITVVGGRDGHGGVLLESQGQQADSTGAGENPANSGGVYVKTKSTFGVISRDIQLTARQNGWSAGESNKGGNILLDVSGLVAWRAENGTAYGSLGTEIVLDLGYESGYTVPITIGRTSTLLDLEVRSSLFYYKQYYHTGHSGQPFMGRYAGDLLVAKVRDLFKKHLEAANNPIILGSEFTGRWLTSRQYNIIDRSFFTIPEPAWQSQYRSTRAENSVVLQSVMTDQLLSGSAPLPGTERWASDALISVDVTTDPKVEEDTFNITESNSPADNHLCKGI